MSWRKKILEMIAEEQYNIESRKRMEDNLRDFSNKIKHTENQSMGVPEEEDKKKYDMRNFWRDYSWKSHLKGKGRSQ